VEPVQRGRATTSASRTISPRAPSSASGQAEFITFGAFSTQLVRPHATDEKGGITDRRFATHVLIWNCYTFNRPVRAESHDRKRHCFVLIVKHIAAVAAHPCLHHGPPSLAQPPLTAKPAFWFLTARKVGSTAVALHLGRVPTDGHVLVVEDEAEFRCVVVQMLTEAGYRVSEADGFEPAIALVERDLSIDLLLTDIGMTPGSPQGILIARMSQYRRVGLKVVYMTGGDATAITGLANGAPVLQKPFARQLLLKTVRSVLI
jgi:CheY-like chemotaxis protein